MSVLCKLQQTIYRSFISVSDMRNLLYMNNHKKQATTKFNQEQKHTKLIKTKTIETIRMKVKKLLFSSSKLFLIFNMII